MLCLTYVLKPVIRKHLLGRTHTQWRKTARISCSSSNTKLEEQDQKSQNIQQQNYARVVYPTALSLLLCNMDRICMSVAILPMSAEFQWSESVQGLVQTGFLWGYLATQIIGGVLADKFGGKKILGYGILWFSIASMLLPILLSFKFYSASSQFLLSLVLLSRFLVGFGEGVVLPSMTNLVSTYIQPQLRATAFGNIFTGFHAGNLVGLILSPFIIEQFGWQSLFLIFGLIGMPLFLMFQKIVPNYKTNDHMQSNSGNQIQKQKTIGVKQLLSTAPCWAIFVSHFMNNWGYFILLGWMPTYFSTQLGFNLRDSSFLSLLPWLVMAVGSSVMGVIADKLLQMGYSLRTVRVGIQSTSFVGMAASILLMAQKQMTKEVAIILLMLTLGFKSMGNAGFLANMSDIAPKNAGELFGLSNTFGSMAGIIGVGLVGLLVEKTGSFRSVFLLTGVMYIVSGIIWTSLSKTDQIFY